MNNLNKEQAAYNKSVTNVFFKLLKVARDLTASIEEEPLRYSLTKVERNQVNKRIVLYNFITPLLYLRLDLYQTGEMAVHYGFEQLPVVSQYYPITSEFVRTIYKLTSFNGSGINIENAIRVDWLLTHCSEAYENLEEQGLKQHQFELIKYKPKQIKRKLTRAA